MGPELKLVPSLGVRKLKQEIFKCHMGGIISDILALYLYTRDIWQTRNRQDLIRVTGQWRGLGKEAEVGTWEVKNPMYSIFEPQVRFFFLFG